MTELAQSHVLRCMFPVMVTPCPAASDATCANTTTAHLSQQVRCPSPLSYYTTQKHTPHQDKMPVSSTATASRHTLCKHSTISGRLYAQRTTRRDTLTRTRRISPGLTGTNTWFHVSHEKGFGQVKGLCLSQQEKQVLTCKYNQLLFYARKCVGKCTFFREAESLNHLFSHHFSGQLWQSYKARRTHYPRL